MTTPSNSKLIELSKQLIKIKSTADNPAGLREAYDFMVSFIRERCPQVTIEEFESNGIPSLLAYKASQRPEKFDIILNGHLDVVPGKPDQYTPVVKDGKLYGRGAYDMKAAALLLAQVFCEYVTQVPYNLGLQLVTDEENAGKHGTRHQIEAGVRTDFVICGDCGRSTTRYEIANQAKGIAIGELGFTGHTAHGAYPWRGDNAIMRAMEFGHALHERYPTPEEEAFHTTATITAINTSNEAMTAVPDNATVRFDIRFTADDAHFQTKAAFTAFLQELDPEAKIVSMYDFCAPAYCDPQNPLLRKLKTAAEAVEKHEFDFVMRHGTGDGRFYANVGDQACEFGIAGEHQHGDGEYITLAAFDNYLATMRDFLASTIR